MNDPNDGVLALLQDIKEMLHGIVLILMGIFLCMLGAWWGAGGWAVLPCLAGLIVLIAGLAYTHHGYNHHEVVEKQD